MLIEAPASLSILSFTLELGFLRPQEATGSALTSGLKSRTSGAQGLATVVGEQTSPLVGGVCAVFGAKRNQMTLFKGGISYLLLGGISTFFFFFPEPPKKRVTATRNTIRKPELSHSREKEEASEGTGVLEARDLRVARQSHCPNPSDKAPGASFAAFLPPSEVEETLGEADRDPQRSSL